MLNFKKIALGAASIACVAALTACGSASGPAAATVNGTVIPESEVTAEVQAFRASMELEDQDDWGKWLAESGYTPEEYRSEVLENLVDKEVLRQAAAAEGVSVEQSQVDDYMASMKALYETDEEWNQMLADAGMTEEGYRAEIEDSMLQEAVQEKVANGQVEATDEEAVEYYNDNRDFYDDAKRSSFIQFSEGEEDKAKQVLDQINSGQASFADAAQENSKDEVTAAAGGDAGWDVLTGQSDEYLEALSELEPGQVSEVVSTSAGPVIIMCTEEFAGPDGDATSVDIFPADLLAEIRESVVMLNGYDIYDEWLENYKQGLTIEYGEVPTNLDYFVDMDKYAEYATADDEDADLDLDSLMLEDEEGLFEDDAELEGILEDGELLEDGDEALLDEDLEDEAA